MTYILGWKSNTSVFISGDMAITTIGEHPQELSKQLSSFQEKQFKASNKKIEESLQKVLNLDSRLIFGFAGDVKVASDFANNLSLRAFQAKLKKPDDMVAIINQSLEDCISVDNMQKVQFIFGVMLEDKPTLFSYNAFNDCRILLHEELVQIGSLTKSPLYTNISAGLSSFFIKGTLPDERMIACVNAIIQSYGVHDNLIEKYGVGGAILGVDDRVKSHFDNYALQECRGQSKITAYPTR